MLYENFITVDDWRCDQYRWINRGVHKLPSNSPEVKKMYFIIDTPRGPSTLFKRHAYQLIGNAKVTLVHYLGDESIATNFPHHGSVEADKIFVHFHHILVSVKILSRHSNQVKFTRRKSLKWVLRQLLRNREMLTLSRL